MSADMDVAEQLLERVNIIKKELGERRDSLREICDELMELAQ